MTGRNRRRFYYGWRKKNSGRDARCARLDCSAWPEKQANVDALHSAVTTSSVGGDINAAPVKNFALAGLSLVLASLVLTLFALLLTDQLLSLCNM